MDFLKIAKNVLKLEADSLISAADKLDKDSIDKLLSIFDFLEQVNGSLIFCGVGKSGHIAQKLAATFSSLGLPSFFLHPVEALHGDLGRVSKNDAIVYISKSGTTSEIMKLDPFLPMGPELKIGLLGNTSAVITEKCSFVLDCSVSKEACINNMAPTCSSTLALAMGDAMAVTYESMVGLSREGFAENHPGGLLGKILKVKVKDLMCHKKDCPIASDKETFKDALLKMTNRPVGGCAILDSEDRIQGILVEGDIRRALLKDGGMSSKLVEVMTKNPICIDSNELAYEALKLMEKREREIDILPVVNTNKQFLGFLRLHDLLQEGFSIKK